MGKIIISVVSFVCCIAALFGIRMMDLPGLITAILVITDVGFAMFVIIYATSGKKAEAGK